MRATRGPGSVLRGFSRVALCLLLGVGLLAGPSSGAEIRTAEPRKGAPSPCGDLAVSPSFASDKTAFCVELERPNGIFLWRTTDGGKSWVRASAAGLVTSPQAGGTPTIFFSPMYESDNAIFIGVLSSGVYRSTDGGESFTSIQSIGGSKARPVVTTVDSPVGEGLSRVQFVEAWAGRQEGANDSVLMDSLTPTWRPITGTPVMDEEFFISPDYESDDLALAIGETGAGLERQYGIYLCDALFACSSKLFSFPAGEKFERLWFSGDFSDNGTIYATTLTLSGHRRMWWSHDRGRNFEEWPSAQELLDEMRDPTETGKGRIQLALAGVPDSRMLFLYTTRGGQSDSKDPVAQLFRSRDGGTKWQRVAYGRSSSYSGTDKGSLPPAFPHSPSLSKQLWGQIVAPHSKHLFILVDNSVICSTDGGKSWGATCSTP